MNFDQSLKSNIPIIINRNFIYFFFYLFFFYSSIEINNSQTQQHTDDSLEDDTNYYDYENLPQSDKKERNKRKRSNSEPRTG